MDQLNGLTIRQSNIRLADLPTDRSTDRLTERTTEQTYAKNYGRLEKFLETKSDTFLMQETAKGSTEVLFISTEEGGAGATMGNATDGDAGPPGEDVGKLARAAGLRWWWW